MNTDSSTGIKNRPELISYLTLRKTVGILGIALPIVLIIGSFILGECREVQTSISAYYYSNMRDVLIGTICTISLFLFAYKGYDRKDSIAGSLAGAFALGVAFFPMSISEPIPECMYGPVENGFINYLHFGTAGLFFIVLSYISICLFTRKKEPVTKRKLLRNKFYTVFGFGIIICIGLIILYKTFLKRIWPDLELYDPIFWLEALALWFFGASWLIKGETILKDTNQ